MDGNETKRIEMNDLLMFFPIHYKNFLDLIFSFIEDDTPRIHIGILLVLKKDGPMPISHIGERLSVARPNMTALVDGLEEKGWIERRISPADRRIANIEITDKGSAYMEQAITKLNTVLREKLSILSEEEVMEFMRSLSSLTSIGKKILKVYGRGW